VLQILTIQTPDFIKWSPNFSSKITQLFALFSLLGTTSFLLNEAPHEKYQKFKKKSEYRAIELYHIAVYIGMFV
jgi:hypothetical protein